MLCKRLKGFVRLWICNFEQEYDRNSKLGWEAEFRSHTIADKHKIMHVVYDGLSIWHHMGYKGLLKLFLAVRWIITMLSFITINVWNYPGRQTVAPWDDVRGISCQRSQLWGLWHTKAFTRMYLSLTLSILFTGHWVADSPHLNLSMVLCTIILSVEGIFGWARSLTKFISTISQFSSEKSATINNYTNDSKWGMNNDKLCHRHPSWSSCPLILRLFRRSCRARSQHFRQVIYPSGARWKTYAPLSEIFQQLLQTWNLSFGQGEHL